MLIAFELLAAFLVLVSLCEYITGSVLDLAFFGVLSRGRHSRAGLLVVLLAKLALWITACGGIISLMWLETGDPTRGSLRQVFLLVFVLVIAPIVLLRKLYARWVKRMSTGS